MKGKISVTRGLVLARREDREADRVASLFTEEFGKVLVRFRSVHRPAAKLRALSEPLTVGEYRLYVRPGGETALCAGGSLASSFPALRRRLDATLRGLELLELFERLTPYGKPSAEKLELAASALAALDGLAASGAAGFAASASWLGAAFALRLLELAGFGLRERRVSEERRALWRALHEAPLPELAALPADADRQRRLEQFLRRSAEAVMERPWRSAAVRLELAR